MMVMIKKKAVFVALLIGVLLSGCGKTSEVDTAAIDNDAPVREEISIEQLEASGKYSGINYESIYLKTIDVGSRNYSYFNLDEDGVPELAVFGEGVAHNDLVNIYTIMEGDVKELGAFGQYGTVQYIKQEGIIYEEYDSADHFYTNIYKMQDGDVTTVTSLQMDYGTDGIEYFIDSQTADESDYEEMLSEYEGKLDSVGAVK